MARRSDHTREQLHAMILDAARRIIHDRGVAGLTTRSIASEIGYTTGTLYQHFEDVADIVLQVNGATMQGLVDALTARTERLPPQPRARVHAYADLYLGYIAANRNAWEAMFSLPRSPDAPVPDWYVGQIDRLVGLVAACFAAMPAGARGTTPEMAARMVWASVHSVCVLDGGGRLELIMRSELAPLVHRLIDVHVDAYLCLAPTDVAGG